MIYRSERGRIRMRPIDKALHPHLNNNKAATNEEGKTQKERWFRRLRRTATSSQQYLEQHVHDISQFGRKPLTFS